MQNGYSFKDGGLDKSTAISMKIREEAASRLSELKQDKINKRQEAASRLLNDQSLRTLVNDTTMFRAKVVDRSQRDDYFGLADPVTFQANKLMNQTQRNQGVVQNVAGATNDRLNKLRVSQSTNIFKPITDKEFLPMIKPLPSADAEVLREELDRLQNESLIIERQRELRLQQMMANQPATEPMNPQRPFGTGFPPPGVPQPQRMVEPPSTDRGSQRSIMTNPMARSFHQLRGERGMMGGNGPPTRSVNFDPKFQRLNDEKLQQLRERDQLEAMIQEKEFFMQQARRQQMARNPPQMMRPPVLDPRQVGVNRVGMFPPGANPNRKPNLVQNSNRNPDLNDFERALLFEEAKELDNVRLLKKLPVGTDLYRFKMEQFKETSTAGGEIEKLVYEQMLKAVKKGQDIQAREAERYVEDLIWDDEQRKNLLAGYIRKQLTLGINLEYQGPADSDTSSEEAEAPPMRFPPREMKYDPTEGFNVYWDYILGMEAFQRYTGFEYQIVCNGDNIKNLEQSTDLTPNIETSDNLCQTILNQRTRFKGIPVNPDMLLIWKVYQTRTENGVDEAPVEIGWTQIDLWTLTRDLKRGVWKCPIYKLPYDPYITKEGIKKLTPIPGAWYHLRIAYPFMDEFNNMSLNPEESRSLAEIPEIHLRAAQFQPPEPVIAPVIEIPSQRPPELNPNTLDRPDDKDKDEFIPPPDPSANRPPPEPPKVGERVGVTVDINRVNRHQAQSHMRISVTCLEGNIPVKDDTMKKWERLTMIHNPLISGEDDNEAMGTAVVASQLVKEGKMANLSKGADIVFRKDTFNLFRNLRAMMQGSGKPVYLIFKLLEKPRPKDVLKGTNKGYDAETEANLGGLQYNTIGYSVFQLSNEKMNLKEGKFIINFLKPPVKNPPFEEGRVPKMDDECQVEFQLALRPYTEKDVDEEYKKLTGQLKRTIAADNASIAGSATKKSQAVITNEPFIENAKRQYPDKIFEKGYGIDFYLDGCRFLPDNVSVTKCIIRVVNQNYKDIFPMKATIPRDLDDKNDAYNPIFNYRYEYRAASIDPTALLFLCFVTIDTSNNESRVIGYAGLNLFVNRYSGLQPTDENDSDIFLQSGNYQLPLHPEEPLRISPFNMQRIENLDKLPCASCLIRVRLAPLSDDLKTVLGKSDVPKAEWREKGIWPERPEYGSGVYNTQFCRMRDSEKNLYKLRLTRAPVGLAQRVVELKKQNKMEGRNMDKKEEFMWVDSIFKVTSSTFMLDGKFFAKYLPQAGFKFTVDAIHNVPNANPFITTYTLNPPGLSYEDPTKTDDLYLIANLDWGNPIGQIKYYNDYQSFKSMPFDPFKHFVIEVKELVFNKDQEFDFIDYGWTIVPCFIGDGYVTNGHYQVPLYKGAYPKEELLAKLREEPVLPVLQKMFQEKKISWTNSYSSVMIRLLDGQREGQLTKKLDIKSLDFMYLPTDLDQKTRFAYNQQVKAELETKKKIGKAIPDNRKPSDYNKLIIAACIEKFQLTRYSVPED